MPTPYSTPAQGAAPACRLPTCIQIVVPCMLVHPAPPVASSCHTCCWPAAPLSSDGCAVTGASTLQVGAVRKPAQGKRGEQLSIVIMHRHFQLAEQRQATGRCSSSSHLRLPSSWPRWPVWTACMYPSGAAPLLQHHQQGRNSPLWLRHELHNGNGTEVARRHRRQRVHSWRRCKFTFRF